MLPRVVSSRHMGAGGGGWLQKHEDMWLRSEGLSGFGSKGLRALGKGARGFRV